MVEWVERDAQKNKLPMCANKLMSDHQSWSSKIQKVKKPIYTKATLKSEVGGSSKNIVCGCACRLSKFYFLYIYSFPIYNL